MNTSTNSIQNERLESVTCWWNFLWAVDTILLFFRPTMWVTVTMHSSSKQSENSINIVYIGAIWTKIEIIVISLAENLKFTKNFAEYA